MRSVILLWTSCEARTELTALTYDLKPRVATTPIAHAMYVHMSNPWTLPPEVIDSIHTPKSTFCATRNPYAQETLSATHCDSVTSFTCRCKLSQANAIKNMRPPEYDAYASSTRAFSRPYCLSSLVTIEVPFPSFVITADPSNG
jgi:hypothetical protein